MTIHTFDTLPSTNQYCELLDLTQVEEFAIYLAHCQTAGIGQRGNHWDSEPGKNLTFSLILKPTFLPVADQYMLTKVLSLGISDYLLVALPQHEVCIKWPNDIYVDGCKICGILTSNRIQGDTLSASICGIGFNINQTNFPDWIPNPTSLQLITNKAFDTTKVLEGIITYNEKWYSRLAANDWQLIDELYLSRLLNLGRTAQYQYHGQIIEATITGVNSFGHLQLTTSNGEEITCQMKDIKYL